MTAAINKETGRGLISHNLVAQCVGVVIEIFGERYEVTGWDEDLKAYKVKRQD